MAFNHIYLSQYFGKIIFISLDIWYFNIQIPLGTGIRLWTTQYYRLKEKNNFKKLYWGYLAKSRQFLNSLLSFLENAVTVFHLASSVFRHFLRFFGIRSSPTPSLQLLGTTVLCSNKISCCRLERRIKMVNHMTPLITHQPKQPMSKMLRHQSMLQHQQAQGMVSLIQIMTMVLDWRWLPRKKLLLYTRNKNVLLQDTRLDSQRW